MNFAPPSILRTLASENHEGATFRANLEEADMAIVKKASAHWEGDLKTGIGSISTETGVLREAPMASRRASKAARAPTRKS